MRRRLKLLPCLVLLAVGAPAVGQALVADPVLQAGAPIDPTRPLAQELRPSASPRLSVTVVGSLLLDGPPAFEDDVRALLAAEDCAGAPNLTIGMLETPLIDLATMRAYPHPWDDRPVLHAAPATAAGLKAQGFGALMLANAHMLDWGIEGMRSTAAALDSAGLARAGIGDTASRAAHAAYFDAPNGGGRIALVATATSFRPTSQALDQQGAAPGRPGVHGIELAAVRHVSPAQLKVVQTAACRFKHPGDPAACANLDPASEATLFSTSYKAGAAPDAYGTTAYEINGPQAGQFLSGVRAGKQSADLLVAAIHADQVDDARSANPPVPVFLARLAQAAVASGADIVMVTGRDAFGPVEIVTTPSGQRAPIFYGLGTFARDSSADGSRQALVARTVAGDSGLRIELIPLDLVGGKPRIAALPSAQATLGQVRALSARLGTAIAIERRGASAIGVIVVPATGAPQ